MKKPHICINCKYVGFWEDDPEVFLLCYKHDEPERTEFLRYCEFFELDDMEERFEEIKREGDEFIEKLDSLLGGKS